MQTEHHVTAASGMESAGQHVQYPIPINSLQVSAVDRCFDCIHELMQHRPGLSWAITVCATQCPTASTESRSHNISGVRCIYRHEGGFCFYSLCFCCFCRQKPGLPMTNAGRGLALSVAKSIKTGGPTAKLAMHLLGEGSGCKLTCTTAPSTAM